MREKTQTEKNLMSRKPGPFPFGIIEDRNKIRNSSTLELTFKHAHLMAAAEKNSKADMQEIVAIEEELRRRLNRVFGRKVIPVGPKE